MLKITHQENFLLILLATARLKPSPVKQSMLGSDIFLMWLTPRRLETCTDCNNLKYSMALVLWIFQKPWQMCQKTKWGSSILKLSCARYNRPDSEGGQLDVSLAKCCRTWKAVPACIINKVKDPIAFVIKALESQTHHWMHPATMDKMLEVKYWLTLRHGMFEIHRFCTNTCNPPPRYLTFNGGKSQLHPLRYCSRSPAGQSGLSTPHNAEIWRIIRKLLFATSGQGQGVALTHWYIHAPFVCWFCDFRE